MMPSHVVTRDIGNLVEKRFLKVVGTRGCFRVILHAHYMQVVVCNAFDGVIVGVYLCYGHFIALVVANRVPVILCRDVYALRAKVQNGLVRASMSKFEFIRLSIKCKGDQLMSETYPEDG